MYILEFPSMLGHLSKSQAIERKLAHLTKRISLGLGIPISPKEVRQRCESQTFHLPHSSPLSLSLPLSPSLSLPLSLSPSLPLFLSLSLSLSLSICLSLTRSLALFLSLNSLFLSKYL